MIITGYCTYQPARKLLSISAEEIIDDGKSLASAPGDLGASHLHLPCLNSRREPY